MTGQTQIAVGGGPLEISVSYEQVEQMFASHGFDPADALEEITQQLPPGASVPPAMFDAINLPSMECMPAVIHLGVDATAQIEDLGTVSEAVELTWSVEVVQR